MGLEPEDEDLRQRADGGDQPGQRKHHPGNEVKSYENMIYLILSNLLNDKACLHENYFPHFKMRSKVMRKHIHDNCFPQFKSKTPRSKRDWCPPGSSRVGPGSRV